MKLFRVYRAGSDKVCDISATCITKACQQFVGTLDRPCGAAFKVLNPERATMWYLDNHSVMSDYVILRAQGYGNGREKSRPNSLLGGGINSSLLVLQPSAVPHLCGTSQSFPCLERTRH